MILNSRAGDLSSALKSIMCFLPEHGLEVIWLPKLGVGGTSWLHKPI